MPNLRSLLRRLFPKKLRNVPRPTLRFDPVHGDGGMTLRAEVRFCANGHGDTVVSTGDANGRYKVPRCIHCGADIVDGEATLSMPQEEHRNALSRDGR